MRRIWLSAASSTSTILNDYINCFQKENRCCGYTNAFDYCCSDENMEIVPAYIDEIEPIEDRIEEVRVALENDNTINIQTELENKGVLAPRHEKLESDYRYMLEEKSESPDSGPIFYYDDTLNCTDNITCAEQEEEQLFYYDDELDQSKLTKSDELGQLKLTKSAPNFEAAPKAVLDNVGNYLEDLSEELQGDRCRNKYIRHRSKPVKVMHTLWVMIH